MQIAAPPERQEKAIACTDLRFILGQGWSHASRMFVVTDADAAAIRAVFQQRGEFAAAIELRRRFPASPTTRRRGSAPGPSPAGSRCGR